MTRSRRPSLALVVALAVASVALLAPSGSARAADRAKPRGVDALVFERASNPVLRVLRSRLRRRMVVRRATRVRLRHPRRYEALIVDGDSSNSRELARRRRAMRRFLDAGASVVAADVRNTHYRRALDHLTGVRIAPLRRGHASRVALFRRVVSGGVPRISIIDARRLLPRRAGRLPARRRRRAVRREARRIAAMVAYQLRGAKHRLAPSRARPAALAAQTAGPPPEVQYLSVSYTYTGSEVLPRAHYDPDNPLSGTTTPSAFNDLRAPRDHGTVQYASGTTTHTFDVYLANADTPGGDSQLVSYTLDAHFSPTSGRFLYMDEPFHWKGFFGQAQDFNLERAWWTGYYDASVTPESPATDGKLSWQSGSPSAPDSAGSYSAGNAFTVDYRASRPPKGPGVAAEWRVNESRPHDFPDWGVANQSTGNRGKWQFSARNNCDVRPGSYSEGGCFDERSGSSGVPNYPNAISRAHDFEVHSSALWKPKDLLADSSTGTLAFTVDLDATVADTYCYAWGVAACSGRDLTRTPPNPEEHRVSIDASAVLPVGIKALTFDDPNPDGSSGEHVKGTVTLKEAAKLDNGTNVVIYSNRGNAVVGKLIGTGPNSTTTVAIPKGKTSANFDITTNDNGLKPGGSTTADITAFYAQPTLAQLHVKARGATAVGAAR